MARTVFEICSRLSVEANASDELKNASNMCEVAFYNQPDRLRSKWHHYLEVYDRHLSRYRGEPLKLLELGVHNGGSLQLWRSYLGPHATIRGIDIDPRCAAIDDADVTIDIGSQADVGLLGKVLDEIGGIDVVVDDGSHIWTHQIATFEFLYPRLSATGTYICEDVHTSYWPEFSGDHAGPSFIEYCKKLLDDLHATYRLDDDAPDETFARITNSISFYDSMVVLERRNKPAPRHVTVGHRAVIV